MATQNPYKCRATFRGFDTKMHVWIRKEVRVETSNVASPGHCPYTVQI